MEFCHLELELSGCNREMAALKRSDLRCIYLYAKWYRVVIFYCSIVCTANVREYKNLRFWANPQKHQTLVPKKID